MTTPATPLRENGGGAVVVSQFRVKSVDVSGNWDPSLACAPIAGSASDVSDNVLAAAVTMAQESIECVDALDLGMKDPSCVSNVSMLMLPGMALDNVLSRWRTKCVFNG